MQKRFKFLKPIIFFLLIPACFFVKWLTLILQFDSRTDFLFTREEMEAVAGGPNALIGKELRITGSVMDWFYNTTAVGFQSAVVIDEDVEIKFLGGSVWSYKPDVPFQIYVSAGIECWWCYRNYY